MQFVRWRRCPDPFADGGPDGAGNAHDHLARRQLTGVCRNALFLALDLTVEATERVGPETFVYGTPSRGAAPAVSANPGELPPGEVIVRIPGSAAPDIGTRIRAVAPRDKLHLFRPDGRGRIEF